ncbi:PH domain-containing protein [Corynebacterium doosanense]|uniref:Membrane protein n=1 Tax=Corynebacterium doosanense CAU 212 = DSM 45436 TaxID=558173 RepID=A0A097IE28_9CORY|nr:PH domain-containing protein [Corynebacterium doosanense]AIT60379.1 membrane protein [Corynebacterium doosanense CAU 212 = DSM 45436]
MHPVSPKLTQARYLVVLPWLVIPALALAVVAVLWWTWAWIGVAVLAALTLWLLWLIPAQVRLLGWEEAEDELLITKGRLWRTLTVVPYGRIQFVDVSSGPIARRLGMKTIELHTASTSSDSSIPGLPAETADALRERLADKARERMSGL